MAELDLKKVRDAAGRPGDLLRRRMKLVALGAVIWSSLGCRDRQPEVAGSATGSAPSAVASTAIEACAVGTRAIERVKCPSPADAAQVNRARQQLQGVVAMLGSGGLAGTEQIQIACAQMILAVDRDAGKLHCTLDLTADERARLAALLEAWYARRTPVVPTGDVAADAVIARVVEVRDAACACTDTRCLDRVDGKLVAIGAFAPSAPKAARDLGAALMDDIGRCAARVKNR